MKYRTDIDGLRAVAILAILLFHIDQRILPGGYVGVDIFFVISGYLIAKIIYQETASNSFSLITFYERRAKRILPAMIAVLLACSVAASLMLYPVELTTFARSALASLFFSANIYFYAVLDYFSPAAHETLLLHLWSLGIEEQFYIFFPLLVLCIRSSRFLFTILIGCFVLSLALSQWVLSHNPPAAFYLLPFRAFELLLGCIIAHSYIPAINNKKLAALLSAAGVVMIMATVTLFKETTPFPGLAATLPCIGTALLILTSEKSQIINKLLSSRALVAIGKLSYSLYLVHWPIIVLFKHRFPYASGYKLDGALFILSFILAAASYHFVEKRFRYTKTAQTTKKIFAQSALAMCACSIVLGIVIHYQGFNYKLDERVNRAISFLQYNAKPAYRYGTCFQEYDQDPKKVDISSCLPDPHAKKKIMMWGDSHAIHLYPGLKKYFNQGGYSLGVLTYSACAPLIGYDIAVRPFCKPFNEIAISTILEVKPEIVIMTANWPASPQNMTLLEKTINYLGQHHIKVILLGESPLYKQNVPMLVAEQIKTGKKMVSAPEMLNLEFLTVSETVLQKHFGNRTDVHYISLMQLLCPQNQCPLATADETPVHFDIAHLTVEGSQLFAQKLAPEILKATG